MRKLLAFLVLSGCGGQTPREPVALVGVTGQTQELTLASDPTAAPGAPLIDCSTEDGSAEAMTVTFLPIGFFPTSEAPRFTVATSLAWNIGGEEAAADVDWINGRAFSVTTSALRLSVVAAAEDLSDVGRTVAVGAFVVPGATATAAATATRSFAGTMPTGSIVTMPIAPFATRVRFLHPDAKMAFSFVAADLRTVIFSCTTGDVGCEGDVAIPSDAAYVRAENRGPDPDISLRFVFSLSI